MSKRCVSRLIITTILTLLSFSHAVLAQEGPPPGEGPRGRSFLTDLDLSQDQREKLRKLRDHEGMRDLAEKSRVEKEKLNSLLKDRKVSEEEILTQFDKVAKTQRGVWEQRIKKIVQMRDILTEEQFSKLKERMEERRDMHRQRKFGPGESGKRGPNPRSRFEERFGGEAEQPQEARGGFRGRHDRRPPYPRPPSPQREDEGVDILNMPLDSEL